MINTDYHVQERSIEAEQTVIGALLIKPDLYAQTAEIITSADFFHDFHGVIYDIIGELQTRTGTCDLTIALEKVLAKEPRREKKEVKEYFMLLSDGVPFIDHIDEYCRIVKKKSLAREARRYAHEAYETGFYNPDGEPHESIQALAEKLADLVRDKSKRNSRKLRDIMLDVHKKIFMKHEDKSLKTGISSLDGFLDGIEPGDLVTIGAGTGVGKTAFALQIIKNMAHTGKKIKLYSQEMSGEQNVLRFIARQSGVELYKLKKYGRLNDSEVTTVMEACEALFHLPVEIDDCGGVTVEDMRLACVHDKDLDLIVVDHIGLMRLPKGIRKPTRNDELTYIMTELRALAMQTQIPIIALAQFNRDSQKDAKEPELFSFRDCGEIEQSSSAAILLWKTADYEAKKIIGVKVAKNRQGEPGTFYMKFDAPRMNFIAVTDYKPDYSRKNDVKSEKVKEIEEIFGNDG